MIVEPKHPTYGTLEKLLLEIESDVRAGYDLRIGLVGALNWFSDQFARHRRDGNDAAHGSSSKEK